MTTHLRSYYTTCTLINYLVSCAVYDDDVAFLACLMQYGLQHVLVSVV